MSDVNNRSGGTNINAHDVNVGGDVVGRDKITVIINMRSYEPTPDLAQLKHNYLEHLQRAYRALDFKGIPQLETLSRELLLEEVYVPLVARPELPKGETWERRLAGRQLDSEFVGAELASAQLASAHFDVAPVRVEEACATRPASSSSAIRVRANRRCSNTWRCGWRRRRSAAADPRAAECVCRMRCRRPIATCSNSCRITLRVSRRSGGLGPLFDRRAGRTAAR